MISNISWINDVVGKPWRDRANGPDAYDCWGLVTDKFLRVNGVELPLVEGYDSGEPIEQIGSPVRDAYGWPEIVNPQDGAVFCVFLSNGDMVHVGVIVAVHKAGLYAVHAAGKDGKGQVIAEPARVVHNRYNTRIKYYMRPN